MNSLLGNLGCIIDPFQMPFRGYSGSYRSKKISCLVWVHAIHETDQPARVDICLLVEIDSRSVLVDSVFDTLTDQAAPGGFPFGCRSDRCRMRLTTRCLWLAASFRSHFSGQVSCKKLDSVYQENEIAGYYQLKTRCRELWLYYPT